MKPGRAFQLKACRILLACSIFALLIFWGGQSKPAAAESLSFVRIVHASPDIGTVDVFVDGAKLLSNFQFATVTSYVPLPAGPHKVQVALIGKGVNAAVITQTLSVQAGTSYTVAALGTQPTGFSLNVFADDNIIAGNATKLRVYHLSPGAGSANVATDTGNSTIQGLTYTQASDYLSVPAGPHTLHITLSPTNTSIPVETLLKPWTVTSIFAIGLLNGSPKLQIVTAQTPGMPGMPRTGSDPTPLPAQSDGLSPWLFSGLLLLAILLSGMVVAQRRR